MSANNMDHEIVKKIKYAISSFQFRFDHLNNARHET